MRIIFDISFTLCNHDFAKYHFLENKSYIPRTLLK